MSGPNRFTEGLLEFADVVASDLANNGEVRVNLGDATTGGGIDSRVPFWGIDGFLSRPANPTPLGACQYLFVAEGNTRYAIGSRDRRFLPFAPLPSEVEIHYPGLDSRGLEAGDRIVYTPSGVRLVLDESARTLTLYSPTNGFKLKLGDDSVRVTGFTTTAFNVALYPTLQAYENAVQDWATVVQTTLLAMLPIVFPGTEVPPPGPMAVNLIVKFAAMAAVQATAADDTLSSSAVLRASTS